MIQRDATTANLVVHSDSEGYHSIYNESNGTYVAHRIPTRHEADILAASWIMREALRLIVDLGYIESLGALTADAIRAALAKSNGAA